MRAHAHVLALLALAACDPPRDGGPRLGEEGDSCVRTSDCVAPLRCRGAICARVEDGGGTIPGVDGGAPATDASASDAARPQTDSGPACVDECAPAGWRGCDGDALTSCDDHDGDGCLEQGTVEHCAGRCYASECVECLLDEDCPDPVRQSCEFGTRTCVAADQWSETTLRYGSSVVMLDNCYFCDATLTGSSGALLRFQQGGGYTIWSLTLPPSATAGTHAVGTITTGGVYVTLNESDASVPSAYRGSYQSTSGTLTLTRAEHFSGGVVEGTLDASLSMTSSGTTARLTATFSARFP